MRPGKKILVAFFCNLLILSACSKDKTFSTDLTGSTWVGTIKCVGTSDRKITINCLAGNLTQVRFEVTLSGGDTFFSDYKGTWYRENNDVGWGFSWDRGTEWAAGTMNDRLNQFSGRQVNGICSGVAVELYRK